MPANLPPEYLEAEERFREADAKDEKISALQRMLSLLPSHKGTDKIEADIRRRISKLKKSSDKKKGPTRAKTPDQIESQGVGQVVLSGMPNTGKSALLDILTNAKPKVADFPFSTYGPTIGMLSYEDVQIQLIDTPPLSEEHVENWVFNLIRKVDLVLLLVDGSLENPREQFRRSLDLLSDEGIYLFPPDYDFKIDEIGRTNRKGLIIVTKNDEPSDEDVTSIFKNDTELPVVPVSILAEDTLDEFSRSVFKSLQKIRVYTKKPGEEPDLQEPYLLDRGSTVIEAVKSIHRDLVKELDYVRIWGSGRFDGQEVAQDHVLEDGDIIEIHNK
ncbi:MAG: GTPase [Candidatus Acetothermia bacterium]